MLVSFQVILVILSLAVSGKPGILNQGAGMEQARVCDGSLNLISGDKTRTLNTPQYFTIVNLEERIMMSRAETHGCGCFVIYTGSHGRDDAYLLLEHENINADIVVRSFRRVEC